MNGNDLPTVSSYKHLGIIMQNDGKWNINTEDITSKAKRRIDIISDLKYKLDRDSLIKLYIAYVRPLIEYGCQVWCNISEGDKEAIENIQIKAARVALGVKKGTSPELMYSELGWLPLETRRNQQKLCMLFKILNDKAPKLLKMLKPKAISRRNSYNTRNTADLDPPKCKTEQYSKSFFPSTIKLWNQLPRDLKETIMSADTFKHRIKPEKKVITHISALATEKRTF